MRVVASAAAVSEMLLAEALPASLIGDVKQIFTPAKDQRSTAAVRLQHWHCGRSRLAARTSYFALPTTIYDGE